MASDPSSSTPFRTSDDLALMHGILDRRQEALAELYDRYAPLLLAVSRRVLASPEEAVESEDVMQETFLQAWNQAERFDSGASSVSAWLVLMARDRALARLRRHPRPERGPQAHLPHAPSPLNPLNTQRPSEREVETLPGVHIESPAVQGRRKRVQEALAALSTTEREVLELAFFGGLSLSEIAERTRTPFEIVKGRALQGMNTMRRDLRAEIRELM